MPEYTDGRVTDGAFKKVNALVREYIDIRSGEKFSLDQICRDLHVYERENRKLVAIALSRLVSQEKLEKVSNYREALYRSIDNSCKYIDWVNANTEDILDIKWPYGIDDDSQFGFDGRVKVSPADVIVIAGTSNMGKTAFCLNFLWENMDAHPCTLIGNEYKASKFARRVSGMTWKAPVNGEGEAKFELIERREHWKDIIRPDNINIIDWLNLGDNWFEIGKVIEGIQSKLDKGIALISIQKDEHKALGRGASFSEELSSLYLTMDFGRLYVRKCKEWQEWNPNRTTYGFDLTNAGTKFRNIRLITKCRRCWGSGQTKGDECEDCNGTGYTDA